MPRTLNSWKERVPPPPFYLFIYLFFPLLTVLHLSTRYYMVMFSVVVCVAVITSDMGCGEG